MEDDTLSVFEPPIRNSGITGGRTADRAHVQRPHAGPTDYYRPADMHVGAVLVVNSRAYELLEADEFTLNFMGMHVDMFPVADGDRVSMCCWCSAAWRHVCLSSQCWMCLLDWQHMLLPMGLLPAVQLFLQSALHNTAFSTRCSSMSRLLAQVYGSS